MTKRIERSPFGTDVRQLPAVERTLRLISRRDRAKERSGKGTQESFDTYVGEYERLKLELENGLPVEPDEHRELSQLFHQLSSSQQSELKGKSPGCLYAREGQGPDGHY